MERDTLSLCLSSGGEELVDVIVYSPVVFVPVSGGPHMADVGEETVAAI
jgi:hypothetical protein